MLIGDALLASKYPYGYSSASLPVPIAFEPGARLLAALPERGDIVVFRLPRDPSQVWVKRVIALPGDRVQMRGGQIWLNGAPVDVRADGNGTSEDEFGDKTPAARFVETLPSGRQHTIFKIGHKRSTIRARSWCRRTGCSSWATIAINPPTAGCPARMAASGCCRSRISSAAWMRWSARGISA